MKKLKKFIISILCSIFALSTCTFLTACGNRSATLRIYVPGEYISNDILQGFEEWYQEQTGKSIKVEKTEFDTCESMYTQIARKKVDYDVICPSDYMVERMINENLLIKLNEETQSIVSTAVSGSENENINFVNLIKSSYDENLEYSAPYMWGTMGILYYYNGNQNITQDVLDADSQKSSWSCLFDGASGKKIYMKDAERDTYTVAMLNLLKDQLTSYAVGSTEYQEVLKQAFEKGNNFESNLQSVKTLLTNQKQYVYNYETDAGKQELLDGKGADGYFGMFWSCDSGYIIADFSGETPVYNTNFRYVVPEEGSNVWIDNLCIPKYAGNTSAANLFIQYMMDSEVAFDCMDFTGCTSGVYQATSDYYDYLTTEDEVFNSTSDAFKSMYLSMMFPNRDITIGSFTINSVLPRCGIMRDFGMEASDQLSFMWDALKKQ